MASNHLKQVVTAAEPDVLVHIETPQHLAPPPAREEGEVEVETGEVSASFARYAHSSTASATMSTVTPAAAPAGVATTTGTGAALGVATDGKGAKYRRPQYVSTLRERYEVIMWMREQEGRGIAGVPIKAIEAFPRAFQASHAANRVKARRWWNQRNDPSLAELAVVHVVGKRPRTKARPGRGRKKADWVARVEQVLQAHTAHVHVNDAQALIAFANKVVAEDPALSTSANARPERLDAEWAERYLARCTTVAPPPPPVESANTVPHSLAVEVPDAAVTHVDPLPEDAVA